MIYFLGVFLCFIAISYGTNSIQQPILSEKSKIIDVLPVPDFDDDSDSLQTSSLWGRSLTHESAIVFTPIIKWENILFVKEWLNQNLNYEIPKNKGAFDLWNTHELLSTRGNSRASLLHCLNNVSTLAPEVNDIIVYTTQKFSGIGHAAIVIKAYDDKITIAEKDPFSKTFSSIKYRDLSIQKRRIGQFSTYKIDDTGLLGWAKIIKND